MSEISIRQLAKEIFIRNKESECTRLNLKATGVASIPQVGLFFIEELQTGEFRIYGKTCNLRDGKLLDGVKFYPDSPCSIWRDIQDENSAWAKKKYLEIPRGSVIFDANNIIEPVFIITLPLKYREKQLLINQIAEEYHLPAGKF